MMLFGLVATVLGSRTVLIKATPRRRVKLVALYTSSLRRRFLAAVHQSAIERTVLADRTYSPHRNSEATLLAAVHGEL